MDKDNSGLILVRRGELLFTLHGREMAAHDGDVIDVSDFSAIDIASEKGDADIVILSVGMVETLALYYDEPGNVVNHIFEEIYNPVLHPAKGVFEDIISLVAEIENAPFGCRRPLLSSLRVIIASEYSRHHEVFDKTGGARTIREYIKLMLRHLPERRDVGWYCNALGVSQQYLQRITRRVLYYSPSDILDRILLRRIARELVMTTRPIQKIAFDLGFRDQGALAKYFRRLTGMTCSDYRTEYASVS